MAVGCRSKMSHVQIFDSFGVSQPSRQVDLGKGARPLSDEAESGRFRSSLGSRFVSCGPSGQWLLVTGTPHHGAHSAWLFDLVTMSWEALPAAPHAILSSAVAVQPGQSGGLEVTILGGWSKMSNCHGHVQRLMLGRSQICCRAEER